MRKYPRNRTVVREWSLNLLSKHSPQGSQSPSEGLIVRYTPSSEVGERVPGGGCMSRSHYHCTVQD